MKFSILRSVSCRLIPSLVTLSCFISANSYGIDTTASGFGISSYVAPVCTATITAVDSRPELNQIRVDIHELCNVSDGYELEILHDGIGISRMNYDNVELPYSANAPTILANRHGAYHGRRVLLIETIGPIGPDIKGLRVRRGSGTNAHPRI